MVLVLVLVLVVGRRLRVGLVVRRVVGGRPQHGEPARAPRRAERLLLAHRSRDRHLAVHPVYAYVVHSWRKRRIISSSQALVVDCLRG